MIRGRVFWITGGSSGIGAALAAELARRGGRVAVTGRDRARLDEVAAAAPDAIGAYAADVRDADALKQVVGRIEADIGAVDCAVLGAGIWKQVNVREWEADTIRDHVETNLLGTINSLDAVIPAMLARRDGQVVGIASVAGYRGFTRAEGYGATKAAEINLFESLRIDLAASGITVQTVNPGFVDTPMTQRNRFWMPFITDPKTAAVRIAEAIDRGKAETVFPIPYLVGLKLLRLVPVRPYTWVSAQLAARQS